MVSPQAWNVTSSGSRSFPDAVFGIVTGTVNEASPYVVFDVTGVADFVQPVFPRDEGAGRIGLENVARGFLVAHGRHRQIGVLESQRVFLDAQINHAQAQVERRPLDELDRRFGKIPWIELPDRLDRTNMERAPIRPTRGARS